MDFVQACAGFLLVLLLLPIHNTTFHNLFSAEISYLTQADDETQLKP